MLSVMDLVDVVGVAEAHADQHRFRELVELLEAHAEAASCDPTLQYLAAYGAYMTGRESEARARLALLVNEVQVDRFDRLHRRILNLRAIVAVETGDLGSAVELLDELEGLAWAAGDHRYVAYATLNKGIAMEMAGRAEDAITEINRAKFAFQKLGDQLSLAACTHNLAMAHRTLRQYWLAESLFDLAADMFGQHECAEERLTAQIELAHCIALSGDLRQAEARTLAAITAARAYDNPRLVAEGQRVLGSVKRQLGSVEDARSLLNAALKVALAGELRTLKCEILIELALIAMQEGDIDRGHKQIAEVVEIFTSMGARIRAQQVEQLLVANA